MIFARLHDRTVAEDYYAAMDRIEQRLDVGSLPEQDHTKTSAKSSERAQLWSWSRGWPSPNWTWNRA
jgi:hypothetical protein